MSAFHFWLGTSVGIIFSLILTWLIFNVWEGDEDELKRWMIIFSIALLLITMGTLYVYYNPPEADKIVSILGDDSPKSILEV